MSTRPIEILSNFQTYAENLIETHKIPAISLAVWHNNQLHQAAAGILNVETGVKATTDSIFQIGSIAKVMTASLVMQLVDEGRVELDKPIKHYIRDFAIADPEATELITVRQLLNHTSGMASDFFPDDIHDASNPIARYVDRCNLLPSVHPVGECYSYSNAAFTMAGRLVEIVTGGTWFDAMEERLFQPLGMMHSICRPMGVLRHRAAIGHVPNQDNTTSWQQTNRPYLTLGLSPIGSTPTMSAADLITFARVHLNGGLSHSGQQWLSASAVSQMQQPNVELPKRSSVLTSHMGLGWGIHKINHNGRIMFGHAGGTSGQLSMLRVVPDQDVCIALLVNCNNESVLHGVTKTLLKELANFDLSEPEESYVEVSEEQLTLYTGDYHALGDHFSLEAVDGQLVAIYNDRVLKTPAQKLYLKALDNALWIAINSDGEAVTKLRFLKPDTQGFYTYLFNGRMIQRV